MRRHIDCVHEKLRPFKCFYCDQTFARKDKLKRHVSSIHFKEKPFSCRYCDHKVSRRDRIKHHVTTVHSKHPEDFDYEPKKLQDL